MKFLSLTQQHNLKNLIQDYVSKKLDLDEERISVQHIAELLACEYPELMLHVAETNFELGFNMALDELTEFDTTLENIDELIESNQE